MTNFPNDLYTIQMSRSQLEKIHIALIHYNISLTKCEPSYREELKDLIGMSQLGTDNDLTLPGDMVNGWTL